MARRSDLGQDSWQCQRQEQTSCWPNVLSSVPIPAWRNQLLFSSTVIPECPGKAPRGEQDSPPRCHPSPALLSLSHPLLGGAKGRKGPCCSRPDFPAAPAAGSRPAHEQSSRGNAPSGNPRPPCPREWLLSLRPSQGSSNPPENTAATTFTQTDLPPASNNTIKKEKQNTASKAALVAPEWRILLCKAPNSSGGNDQR